MKRETEFRGLRTDGKGWVYGYLIRNEKISGIIPYYEISFTCDGNALDFGYIQVIPETVGQFTGLRDKNGVKIFEGKNCIKLTLIGLGEAICDVVFENGVFGIYEPSQGFLPLIGALNNNCIIIEVIGNIYENK